MTISATCPKGHTLTLEEKLAGKKIRCPRCQVVFQVPDLEAEVVEEAEAVSEKPLRKARRSDDDDDDDDRPRRKARAAVRDDDDDDDDDDDRPRGKSRARPRDDDDDDDEEMDPETRRKLEKKLKKKQLKLVDVGLLLHYIKLCMYIVGILLAMAVGILTAIAGAQAADPDAAKDVAAGGGVQNFAFMGYAILVLLAFVLNLIISLLAPLFGVVGSFLCCWVPKKSEAKGTIIISLSFDLVSLISWLLGLLAVTGVFGMEAHKTANMVFYLQCIAFVCTVTSWLTFLTFMRSLGAYIGEPGLGNEALNLIARLVVQVVTLILDFMLIVAFGRYFVGVFLAIIIAIVAMIIWLIFFIFTFYIRQLKLVSAMRQAVQNKL